MKKVYASPSPLQTDFSASPVGVSITAMAPLYDLVDDGVTVDITNKTYNIISKLFTLSYRNSTMVAPFIFNGDSQYVKRILGASVSLSKLISGDSGQSTVNIFGQTITVTVKYTDENFLLSLSDPSGNVSISLKDDSRRDTFISNGVDGYLSGTVTGVVRGTRPSGETIDETEQPFSVSVQGSGTADISAGAELPYVLDGCKNSQTVTFAVPNGPVVTMEPVLVTITINNSLNTSTDFE